MLIKEMKKEAKAKKDLESIPEKEEKIKYKSKLGKFLNENKDEHLNFNVTETFLVSTGSLTLDDALGGGLPPGIHRFGGASEGGKALPIFEPVLTPVGWIEIGNIKVGDFVIGKNGKPTEVIGVYPQGIKPIFKLTTEDNGEVNCCDDHLWETSSKSERTLTSRKKQPFFSVKTTRMIRNTLLYDSGFNHCIPYCDKVVFRDIKKLPIDNYVLGVILGDGGVTGCSACITNTDQELIDKVDSILKKEKWYDGLGKNGTTYRIRGKGSENKWKNQIKSHLKELGLMGLGSFDKFIPKEYLFNNSIEGRESLLQGLMDTDGYVKPDSCLCQYYTTSPQLAIDVQELVRSLGGRASLSKKKAKYYNHKHQKWVSCKDCWNVNISFSNEICPVSLSRKKTNHRKKTYYSGRFIKNIVENGESECVCIKVAATDGLFVTKDYIVTHNTSSSLEVIKNFLSTVPNSKGLIVKAEGRLPEKMKKRSGLKFVDNPDDWEIGTVFIFKCNVYEPVAQLVQDLILDNPENIKYAFLLDSLDGLNLREDLVKSFIGDDNARVCGSPAITKRLFRRLSLPINELCHLFIIICQIIASIPAKFDPKEQLVVGGAGGNAAIHFSNWSLKFLPHYKGDLIIGGIQDEEEGEGKGKKKAAILTFGESNVVGHWAKVKLEKTENEKSGQDVTYPIKYATDTEEGRIWTELEIQRVAMIRKLLYKEKTSYIFIPPVLEKMRKEGLDVPDKIVGMPKLEAFFARPEVSDFWKKFIRELNENKELL